MRCFFILLCALWIMINGNQYFLTVPIRFLNRRNIIKDSDCGIWHVFAIGIPALVTVCLLVICFFPHLIISRFDNIPCSTPRYSTPLSLFHLDNLAFLHLGLFHLDNLALVIATILIAGTLFFWFRRLWNAIKKKSSGWHGGATRPVDGSCLSVVHHFKLNRAIIAIKRLTNCKLPEVKIFNSQLPQCFTQGWMRPKIWISYTLISEMNVDDLQVILAHEYCHVLRYDNLVSRILTVISELSWTHLGCRTLLKSWYERRELFCDNFSARVVTSRQKVASTLIKLAEAMMRHKSPYSPFNKWGKGDFLIKGGVGGIGTAFYYEDKPLIQTRVENLLCNPPKPPYSPFDKGGKGDLGGFRGIKEHPISSYRYKLWLLALFGLCMFIFVVMVSITLANSLTHIHCLMEDMFSFYCSAC